MASQATTVTTNIEIDPWTDLAGKLEKHNPDGATADINRVGVLPQGMKSGRASVMFDIRLPNGDVVLAETSLRNFRMISAIVTNCPVALMEEM